jgi:hypothetical protein
MEVQCIARTSGLQTGRILQGLTTVKIYGRASPSHTYQISGRPAVSGAQTGSAQVPGQAPKRAGAALGIPGDSGAWVIDRQDGRLCGHVLAWSERKQVAYICPMDVLLLDIAETLEARDIRLPGGEAVVTLEQARKPLEDYGHEEFSELESLVDEEEFDEGPEVATLQSPPTLATPHRQDEATQASKDEQGDEDVKALASDMEKVHIPGTEVGLGFKMDRLGRFE